jgi:hypothetical protein
MHNRSATTPNLPHQPSARPKPQHDFLHDTNEILETVYFGVDADLRPKRKKQHPNSSASAPARFDPSQTLSQAPIRIKTTPNMGSIRFLSSGDSSQRDHRPAAAEPASTEPLKTQIHRSLKTEPTECGPQPNRPVVISAAQLRLVTLNPASLLAAEMQSITGDVMKTIWPDKRPEDHLAIELFGTTVGRTQQKLMQSSSPLKTQESFLI